MDRVTPRTADEGLAGVDDWVEGDDEIVSVGEPIPHVLHVEPTGPLAFFVRFDDGVEGTVRFDERRLRGAFAKLRDPDYFRQVGIFYGAISWPNEDPDMAPDRMRDELVAGDGEWVVQ